MGLAKRFVEACKHCKILVIGDVMIDRYVEAQHVRVSPEGAPALVATLGSKEQVLREEVGGAGNVAANLDAMGAKKIELIGCEGNLANDNASFSTLLVDATERVDNLTFCHPTVASITKTRYLDPQHGRTLFRLDIEAPYESAAGTMADRVISKVESTLRLATPDLVIISDYKKGVISRHTMPRIAELLLEQNIPYVVDPKQQGSLYGGPISLPLAICPNWNERGMITAEDAQFRVVTDGANGCHIFKRVGSRVTVPTRARKVNDTTGCGDAFVAALAIALIGGLNIEDACRIANAAGACAVSAYGNVRVAGKDIIEELDHEG